MKAILPIFVTIWRSLDSRGHRSFFLAFFLFLSLVATRISTPFYFAYIVFRIQAGAFEPLLWFVGYAILFVMIRVLEEVRFAVYVYFEQYFQKSLALTLLRRFYLLPQSEVGSQASAETAIIVDRGLGGLRNVMYNLVFSIGPLAIETIVLIVVLARTVSLSLSAVVFAILVAFVLITYKFTNKISILQNKWYRTSSKNFKILSESVKSQETVRSLEKPEWIERRYAAATDTFIKQVLASLSPGVFMSVFQGLLVGAIIFSVSVAIVGRYASIVDAIPLLVLANGLILQIIAPLVQFAAAYRIFIQGISSAQQLVHLLSAKTASLKRNHSKKEIDAAIQVGRIDVQYSDGKRLGFKDFAIKKQSCAVIVGRTGAGKSTLARVIAGLQDYSGDLIVDPASERIFYLGQQIDVFDTTLEANVTMEAAPDTEKLTRCLALAGFTDQEIEELSGRDLGEGGSAISGGQRSRLGIARMLYHEADTIIFDEPTASLDAETAATIRSTIFGLLGRATVVVVTHDQAFVENAEQVFNIGDISDLEAGELRRI
jgi:ABC-type transport system involved in cytochrome bd biosynthesis fused ATPase/permease subunit